MYQFNSLIKKAIIFISLSLLSFNLFSDLLPLNIIKSGSIGGNQLTNLYINGVQNIKYGETARYTCIATLSFDGTHVVAPINWRLSSNQYATLTLSPILMNNPASVTNNNTTSESKYVTLYATYTYNGMTRIVNKLITLSGKPSSYTVTTQASPYDAGTVTGSGTYASGDNCTLTATPSAGAGYTFSHWTKGNSNVSTENPYTFKVSENATYTANFTKQAMYTVTATTSPAEGGNVSGGGQFRSGESCTLTAAAKSGYVFSCWKKNGNQVSTSNPYTFTVEGDASYTAVFTKVETYTITTTANPSAGGTVIGAGKYISGDRCTLTATAKSGYVFSCWMQGGYQVSTSPSYTFLVTCNATYTAVFVKNSTTKYTISVNANPSGGGTVTGGGQYASGTSCTLTATPKSGYVFSYWKKGNSQVGTESTYTFPVSCNATYTAVFTKITTYTVNGSASPSNGGTVSGGGKFMYGDKCTLTATPKSGYLFSCWKKGSSQVGTESTYTFTVTGNVTYTAVFTKITTYTVTESARPSNGGTVSGGGKYTAGEKCTLTATPKSGYVFSCWKKGSQEVSTDNAYTFTVTGNVTYTAVFTKIATYTVTGSASPSNGGTVSGGGKYTAGDKCTLTATPKSGYVFSCWKKGSQEVGTDNAYTFTVTGNVTYTAVFTKITTYTVTGSARPSNGGTVSGGGKYTAGEKCTLTATPKSGYVFSCWKKGSQEVSTDNAYTFTVTGNATYTAYFTKTNPSIAKAEIRGDATIHFSTDTTKRYNYYLYIDKKRVEDKNIEWKIEFVEGEDTAWIKTVKYYGCVQVKREPSYKYIINVIAIYKGQEYKKEVQIL